ncbi:Uncharacterised protein [Candidatus Bilamarchaeum dharawalense]|uniref:Yip1 domain protein n=1 Tax=Candidatus Bilamarchaeum dharawalense TaxID=2885759 RepID=A0A5E4LRQ8_9ARCH|nr:Uncharacterised protein [Candidatus Bilamarchaeum dharawalense]
MSGKKTFEKLKKQIKTFSPLVTSWNSAKELFNPKTIDKTLTEIVGLANLRLAVTIFIIAAFLSTLLSILALIESAQLVNFTSETITEALGVEGQKVGFAETAPLALFQLITGLPLALIVNMVGEWIGYRLAKISGGKGTFEKQFYLASVITLSLAMVNVLALLTPIPCVQVIAWMGIVIGMIYLGAYVMCKAYSMVHEISFVHSLAIVLMVSIMRAAVIIFVMNLISAWLNLPAYFELQ